MLYLILGWLALGGVAALIGDVLLASLEVSPQPDRSQSNLSGGDRLLLSLWLGIGSLSLILLALSLVMPLKPIVGLLLGLAGLAIGFGRGGLRSLGGWSSRQVLAWIVTIVGAAAWCNRPITWHDTGYYHYSLVQWLGQYGTVPGLALLFNNLGFTSSWFALTAPFNPDSLAGRPLSLANGFIFLLLLGQGAAGVKGLISGRRWVADAFSVCWVLLMLPLVLFLDPLSKILRSASPDLPVTLLVGVIAWVILWLNDRQRDSGQSLDASARSLPLGLALLAVTFKLIALPLLPITFLFAVWRQSRGAYGRAIGLVVLILSPMVVGNLLTSGCPLYPGHVLCIALPWSPAPASLESAAIITHGWTSWYGTPPPGANPWLWSLGQWFMSSSKEKITALGIVVGLTIALGLAVKFLKRSGWRGLVDRLDRQGEPWLCGMGLLGLAFVMANSPFFRFSAPYIVLLLAIGLARLLARLLPLYRLKSTVSSDTPATLSRPAIALSLSLVALCLALESRSFLIPPPMEFSALWLQKETNGIVYRSPQSGDVKEDKVPNKDMCWTAEIPCAYSITSDIYLRNPDRGIAGGFVRR
jgi:hypothetical protein